MVTGLALGAVYAPIATGFYLTHLTVEKVSFGQGDFAMVAAFLMLSARLVHWPLWVAIPVMLTLTVLGLMLERIAVRPLERNHRRSAIGAYAWILTTAGIAFILQNLVELAYGKSSQHVPPLFSDDRNALLRIGNIIVAVVDGASVVRHSVLYLSRGRCNFASGVTAGRMKARDERCGQHFLAGRYMSEYAGSLASNTSHRFCSATTSAMEWSC